MMRSVSLVERLELDFSGNHFSHALALGDVDSDEVRKKLESSVHVHGIRYHDFILLEYSFVSV